MLSVLAPPNFETQEGGFSVEAREWVCVRGWLDTGFSLQQIRVGVLAVLAPPNFETQEGGFSVEAREWVCVRGRLDTGFSLRQISVGALAVLAPPNFETQEGGFPVCGARAFTLSTKTIHLVCV